MSNTRSSNGGNRPRHRMNRRQREELMRKRKIATAVILMVIIIAAAGIIWGIVALVRHSRGGADKPQQNSQVTQTAQSGQNETQAAGSQKTGMLIQLARLRHGAIRMVLPRLREAQRQQGLLRLWLYQAE